MLKLTNSFYRYLWLTVQCIHPRVSLKKRILNDSRDTHTFSNLSKSASLWALASVATQTNQHQQCRQFSNKKKQRMKKQIQKLNVSKILKQMSESVQPTVNNVSCGGQFKISPADESQSSTNHWKKDDSSERHLKKHRIPAGFRRWEPVGRRHYHNNGSIKFKVVSYNVLAQYLLECHPYLYSDCSSNDLKWEVRSSKLYDEIIKLDPDILCLQEVQATHLSTFYEKFSQIGYHGVFKQKTGDRCDGCAIYFKKSEFHLVDQMSVEFYQPELPLLNRDNIGIMVRLVPKAVPDAPFVVATTHLLYNPRRTDVRLAQIQVFLAEIDRFAYYNNRNGMACGHMPIIMSGDLNSTPDNVVVRLLNKGRVSAERYRDNSDWKIIEVTDNCQHLSIYLSRQNGYPCNDVSGTKIFNSDYCQPLPPGISKPDLKQDYNELFNSGVIRHSLKLKSVYDTFKSNGHYEATTFQDYWVTVDYIYFSDRSNLSLLERLRLPTVQECEVLGRLPNEVYASDHLALGALFEIRPRKSSL